MQNKGECRGSDDKVVQSIIHRPPSHTDPNGSYTGNPIIPTEKPEQDADDL